MKSTNSRKGFTLIELSIVLVILGLIVATIAPLFVSLSKKNKLSEGKKIVDTARDEIKGEIIRSRVVPNNLDNIGHVIDPWQNDLVYIPAQSLAGNDLCTWLGTGTNQTGLAVCEDGDCTGSKRSNVAFIIASKGANVNRQLEDATNHDANTADREVRLYGYGDQVDQYGTNPDFTRATDQFDDIVDYVSVAELIEKINCSVSIVNETGQTVCSGGAAVTSGNSLGILNINQLMAIGSTSDNCITIDSTCTISHELAQSKDGNMDQQVRITSVPPACTLHDL